MKILSILKKSLFLFALVPVVGGLYAANSSLVAERGGERGNFGGEERGNYGGEERGSHPESNSSSEHPMDKPYNQGEAKGFEQGAEHSGNQGNSGNVYIAPGQNQNNNPLYQQNDPYAFPQPYPNNN
jgi:hypothetical protein